MHFISWISAELIVLFGSIDRVRNTRGRLMAVHDMTITIALFFPSKYSYL